MGTLARGLGYAGLIVVGDDAAGFASAAPDISHRVQSLPEAAEAVRTLVASGAVVLVKASRVAGLERLVPLIGGLGRTSERAK
jgi:UDP-N-acetylmuramoyl-tripeptide--D-alanyl-D-alanine ligase